MKKGNHLTNNLFFKPQLDKNDDEIKPILKLNAMKLFKLVNEEVGK